MLRARWIGILALLACVGLVAAGCAGGTARVRVVVPVPVPAPEVEAVEEPKAVEPSAEVPDPEVEIPPPAELTAPREIRVGLATDLPRVEVPLGGTLRASNGDRLLAVSRPLSVVPARPAAGSGTWTVQVAALRDERQAEELARQLGERTGVSATATFDAGIDLYRVRVGSFASEAEAGRIRQRLVGLGMAGAWVTALPSGAVEAGLRLTHGDEVMEIPARWVAFDSDRGQVGFDGRRYRGRLLVYLNDRGLLNAVNELTLEDYLRGVVPKELGPGLYNELEALKAQAVAARTYTLRNLGEFAGEGYDICATPRCQVYGGQDAEHPLSDRAVRETAGEILTWNGEPVDALYSSTCGGHTENVEVVFPLKSAAYLRGVPCVEDEGDLLAGFPGRDDLAAELFARMLPAAASADPRHATEARLLGLAGLAGLEPESDRLRSLERAEVQRFVASVFDLDVDARLFLSAQDQRYLVTNPPADWDEGDRRLAAFLAQSGWLAPGSAAAVESGDLERLALELALYLGVVERRRVTHLRVRDGRLEVREGDEAFEVMLPPDVASFRESAGTIRPEIVRALPGDRLDLYLQGDRLLALVHHLSAAGAAHDRSSRYSRWTRFRSDSDLRTLARQRFPGFELTDFEVLDRGVSGRVGAIRLLGDGGTVQPVEGLAVRWTLDLPDTRFTARRLTPADGRAGWLFTGRGWGHGVGMCQIGAFGMARRGSTYREILHHYYTGVRLTRVEYR